MYVCMHNNQKIHNTQTQITKIEHDLHTNIKNVAYLVNRLGRQKTTDVHNEQG